MAMMRDCWRTFLDLARRLFRCLWKVIEPIPQDTNGRRSMITSISTQLRFLLTSSHTFGLTFGESEINLCGCMILTTLRTAGAPLTYSESTLDGIRTVLWATVK